MAKNALVLGGGGALGISWATGVLTGLQREGVDATTADLLIGTSAGSVVAAQIAQGYTLEELIVMHHEPRDGGIETVMEFDVPNLMAIFAKWAAYDEMTQQARAEIGAMALASPTVSEDRWIDSFDDLIKPEWPERPLLLAAVDANTGEFKAWSREDGVDLKRAVASSCSVPGIFPCVEINGRRWQDGGVRSGTNADLASGFDNVLMLAPIGARTDSIDPLLGKLARRELEVLRAEGTHAELAFPDEASVEAMGINRMDSTRLGITADAGIEQGRALAVQLASAWSTAAA